MAANPMTQFEVYRIGPEVKIGAFDISFTNASLFMVISTLAILLIFNLGSKKNSILPNKIQLLAELSYTFVSKMISMPPMYSMYVFSILKNKNFHVEYSKEFEEEKIKKADYIILTSSIICHETEIETLKKLVSLKKK